MPNGEKRHISVANRLKAEGVRRGTPDIFICLPEGRIAWLEMKAAAGSLSPEQKAFRAKVEALGHPYAAAKTVKDALAFLSGLDAIDPNAMSYEEAARLHVSMMGVE